MAGLALPVHIYNWIADFLSGRQHCTSYGDLMSCVSEIFVSVIQGSALGPATYAVNAADLRPINSSNEMMIRTDDTYLLYQLSVAMLAMMN